MTRTEGRFGRTAVLFLSIVAAGVGVRLAHYLANRSLWLDEAMIALNIVRRPFGDLVGSLDFNQAAPLGFLWLEKAAFLVAGPGEPVLRFWPLFAGIAALVLFAILARRFLASPAAAFATAVFAVSASLGYYSAEVKQYSFDVALAVLLMLLATERDANGRPRWVALAVAGALGVWLSHPLVFVLPAVLVFVRMAGQPAPDETPAPDDTPQPTGAPPSTDAAELVHRHRPYVVTGIVWAASFAAAFLLTARDASQSPLMARFWAEGFMPLPPTSVADLRWFVDAFAGWVRNTFDFTETVGPVRSAGVLLGGALAVAGIVAAWRRDRRGLALAGIPIALALGASALGLYPFRGRLILFLVPSTLLLAGWGLEAALAGLPRGGAGRGPRAFRFAGMAGAAGFVACTAVVTAGWLASPGREELRPVLAHVAANARPGDAVYLHSGAQHAHLYYERSCAACRLDDASLVRGGFLSGDETAIARDLAALPDRGRVWLVFSHEWWGYGDVEREAMTRALEAGAGPPVESFDAAGASAVLYDLGS